MRLLTAESMRRCDAAAMTAYGIPGIVLMENAGAALTQKAVALLGGVVKDKVVAIFAGCGNNGGDGFVVARRLHNLGAEVRVFLLGDETALQGDAAANWQTMTLLDIPYQSIKEPADVNLLKVALLRTDLVVDAIFGTGFHGAVQGVAAGVIQMINAFDQLPVLAADIPSGVQADTGQVENVAVQASATVTFAWGKPGLFLAPGSEYAGEVEVADIALPYELLDEERRRLEYLDAAFCKKWLKVRRQESHKGDFGHVLILGGSRNMTGAPIMAAKGAIAAGAGLVTVAAPEEALRALRVAAPEAMTLPLETNEEGYLLAEEAEKVLSFATNKVIVLGMGLGRQECTRQLVMDILAQTDCPVVVDADGLYAMSVSERPLKPRRHPLVMTPHPGEMGQLLEQETAWVQQHRSQAVEQCARTYGGICLLKGNRTLIADGDLYFYINSTGNPGMATGGSGDVLSGVIGALLAQGLPPMAAAGVGAYLHGKAGDEAAQALSQLSMNALDIVGFFPAAVKGIQEKE